MRENENLKQRIFFLEKENKLFAYEKSRLEETLDRLKITIEDRVPVINEVEKRRIELEQETS